MSALPLLDGSIALGEELGRGAFGVVHRGQLASGEAVAVKLHPALPASEEARVHREAELLEGLRHPRLVTFHGLYRGPDDQLALVYELVEGMELEERLREGPLTLVETLPVAAGVAEGLDALHQIGLVHRDLKPGNIMLGPDGSPRLIDYGMLRSTEAGKTLTATRAVVGTPAYMAPEQITGSGRPTAALDQYALGCVIYECLAGLPPFDGELSAILDGHLKRPPPRLRERAPHLPQGLQAVLERMLAKEPVERFSSCSEAVRALDAARRGLVSESQATQVVADGERLEKTRPLAGRGGSSESGVVESTASLPGAVAPPPVESESGGALPRVAAAAMLAGGILAGFLGGAGKELESGEVVLERPQTPKVDFPEAPAVPSLVASYRFSKATPLAWSSWLATDPATPLYEEEIDRGHDVYTRNLPVLLGDDLLAVTTSRGGVALLERETLRHRASWRLESLDEKDQDGRVRENWFSPFLAPGPGSSVWLTASARGAPPASIRLDPPVTVEGHQERPLVPAEGGGGWKPVEVFSELPVDGDPRTVRVERTVNSHDGEAWIANADSPGFSSWIRERGERPRPLSVLQVPWRGIPEVAENRSVLHVSGREIRMRPFRAGGGWVRGAAVLIKPSSDLSGSEERRVAQLVAGFPGSRGTVRGHAAYATFSAERPGTPEGPRPPEWVLHLTGYPEVYPYPLGGGFLMVHGGRLVHYPTSALSGEVAPGAGRELDSFEEVCPEERYMYPAGTMTFDERTGLDLLIWENLRFCRGQDVPQRIHWYRYPDFRVDDDGTVRAGERTPVAYWELSLESMGVDRALLAVGHSMSVMDFPDLVKNPGFRRDQRLPGGRLWIAGVTSIDLVNRLLVLDLARARVVDTLEAGNIKAIQAGPVLYRGNEPGHWEVYLSDRGGRLLGARLPRTRPEDG